VTFRKAVEGTPHLEGAWRAGLGALRTRDRGHIEPSDPRRLQGSVDIDGALRNPQPNANRWDFAIGYRHTDREKDCIYWVEIHTAEDKEFKVVLRKMEWLRTWLTGDGKILNQFERDFVWVSSGANLLTLGAPQLKQLAQLGLQQKTRRLRIPSQRTH